MTTRRGGWWASLSLLALAATVGVLSSQEPQRNKDKASGQPAATLDAAAVRKLVELLGSKDFKTREKAGKELLKLDEVPGALRDATKSADLEERRRAQTIVDAITDRLEERAFQAMVGDLQKVEIDRFIRRMITDVKFAGDRQWDVVQTLTKAVTKKANELGGGKFGVRDFDMKLLPLANLTTERVAISNKRILLSDPHFRMTSVQGCVLLCTGSTPRITGISNSIVIVDGDFTRATVLDNSLLIVSGNIGGFTGVRNSIILAKGEFGQKRGFGIPDELVGATTCDFSFLQVKNETIRFTGSTDCVLVKTIPKTTGRTNSRNLDIEQGPLQLLKFGEPRKAADDQLVWGKEVNGLAVAVAPVERKDSYFVRWKNVGTETLELPWVRFHSDPIVAERDDLWNHVLLKGADGKPLPARQSDPPRLGGPTRRPRTVILAPGKSHEETIDLVSYVNRPATPGRYQLSIELDIESGPAPSQKGVTYWAGKIQSNQLEVTFGK